LTGPKEEHTCDENAKATVSMLAKDTKPCPTCGTMIFKISGCSQMWCPDCHSTFDWNSGRIESGIVHNPHYYEWLRRTGGGQAARNHGDYECGGLPAVHSINALGSVMKCYAIFIPIYRLLAHIQRVEINRYHVGNAAQNNEDLRINYMLNELDEKQFAFTLQKREKERLKKQEYYQIYQTVFNAGAEYMRQLDTILIGCFENNNGGQLIGYYRAVPMKMVNEPNTTQITNILTTFENLRMYVNGNFSKVGNRYKCKYPCINVNWTDLISL
jgi:hypothetical protein